MRILSLVGTRPQYIKEAVLHAEFNKEGIEEVLVNSGQHYDAIMSHVFFQNFNIKKTDYNLQVGSATHSVMTAKIMIKLEKVIERVKPNLVIVYGDTNTTLAGALVTAKMKIPLAHVEAGLRSKPSDAPEEINRVLTDHVSQYLFCPSIKAVDNLKKEHIAKNVFFTGDVMYDLFLQLKERFSYTTFHKLGLKENSYILMTLHRDFNVDNKDKLKKILREVQKINKKIQIVFPVHPRTKKRINQYHLSSLLEKATVIEPVDYLTLMGLLTKSKKIITDSGGLQKEAYFAGKKAIVLMPDTGWIELIENKHNILADENNLYEITIEKDKRSIIKNIYGEGNAGKNIVQIIKKIFHET